MSNNALFRDVKPVSDNLVVKCTEQPVSEFLWVYFEFSYDPEFKNPNDFIVPDAGSYDILYSENEKNMKAWQANHDITSANYTRLLLEKAGLVRYVKVNVNTAVTTTVPPPSIGAPLYVRVLVAKC